MKIAGFGVCGKGEEKRYLENTLKEFQRLCDETYIVCNNCFLQEKRLIEKYKFHIIEDNREWGKEQWRIKEDAVRKIKADWFVVLDMDEVFDKNFNREELEKLCKLGGTGFYFYLVNLMDEGYSPNWSFWNIRLFNGSYSRNWERKPLHCGLAPKIAYHWGNYAPFIVKHFGLKLRDDRIKKFYRYKKYDPRAKFKSRIYYDMLISEVKASNFDEDKLHLEVENEVKDYKFKKPRFIMEKFKKFYFVKNPAGKVVDIEERYLDETIKREGFELLSKDPVIKGGSGVETTMPAEDEKVIKNEEEKEEQNKEEVEIKKEEKDVDGEPKDSEPSEFTCEVCGFIAKSKAGLAKHQTTHEK